MLSASREQLEEAGGEDRDVCALISAARELVDTGLREDLVGSPVEVTDPRLLRYLKVQLGRLRHECFYAVYLDRAQRYIRGEAVGSGSRSGVESRMGLLFRRAIELRASGLLLAHNHPSGNCTPSRADLQATDRIDETARRLDLDLLDHLIVTPMAVYSIKKEHLL